MGNTQVVWQNLYMVFWGLASLIFVLGFIVQMIEHGDRWFHAIAAMGLLVGLAVVFPNATTSFMNLNESVRESLYPAGTNVSDLYTYMKNVKTKETAQDIWGDGVRGIATYPFRKAVDELLEYVCRTCIFIGELASAVSVVIITFTFKLFKVVSPLLISFCYFKFTQSAGIKFLTLTLGLCLAPYAFVMADFMLLEIFTSLNALVTNTVLNNTAANIVAVTTEGAALSSPGGAVLMSIGAYLILSFILGLISIFVYIGAPACLMLLLSGESPANSIIMAAMAGGQTVQALAGTATDAVNTGMNMANSGSKMSGKIPGQDSFPNPNSPSGTSEGMSSTSPMSSSAPATSMGTQAGAASAAGGGSAAAGGSTAAAGAGATVATGGAALPVVAAVGAGMAAVKAAEVAAEVTAKTTEAGASTASNVAASSAPADGAVSYAPPPNSEPPPSANSQSSGASGFNTNFSENPEALTDLLTQMVNNIPNNAPPPSENSIDPNGYNRRKN